MINSNTPKLRAAMLLLCSELDLMLEDHAFRLAMALEGSYPTQDAIDDARDAMVAELAQFLTRDKTTHSVAGHQIGERHAASFFKVDHEALSPAVLVVDGARVTLS